MINQLYWLLIIVLTCVKTCVFHVICCKPANQTTKNEKIISWVFASIPALAGVAVAIPIAFLESAFGPAMATQPIQGSFYESMGSFSLLMPLYYAWALNLVVIPMACALLGWKKMTMPYWRVIAAYFAITGIEYIFTFCSLAVLPHQWPR